mgnify:CR=1 FL=1
MHEPRIAKSQRHYPERTGLTVSVSVPARPGGGAARATQDQAVAELARVANDAGVLVVVDEAGMADVFARPLGGRRVASAIETR